MPVQFINPDGLAKGTYSHVAVVSGGGTIYVSGQVSADEQGAVVGASFAEQTRQVFENLRTALAGAGARFEHIVKMNIYVVALDAPKVQTFREIRKSFLGSHIPASTLVDTGALVNPEFQIEVEAVAVVD